MFCLTSEKKKLMAKIQNHSFALDEARLFLDSHPDCEEAVKYYEKNLDAYKEAVKDYENRFAPIGENGAVMDGKWAWNTTPWPWERSEN